LRSRYQQTRVAEITVTQRCSRLLAKVEGRRILGREPRLAFQNVKIVARDYRELRWAAIGIQPLPRQGLEDSGHFVSR
jgi:hypothetical protein